MQQTSLNSQHRDRGAVMVDFAGWDMPIRYGSIKEEHHNVRQRVGLFDLGHMARIDIRGPDREVFLEKLVTNRVADLETRRAHYALLCREDGGILDDVIYYKLEDRIFLVANASNREKVLAWLTAHREGLIVDVVDRTAELGMLAVQGPLSIKLLDEAFSLGASLAELPYYSCTEAKLAGSPALLGRTGYTGEDGFEIYLPSEAAPIVWAALLEKGAAFGALPIGLGARDTLRMEACMPLYGHEIDENTNPLEAGLKFAVKLDKHFVGREALAAVKAKKPRRRLIAFHVESRRVARQHHPILHEGEEVGQVTSGTHCPTLGKNAGLGYVPRALGKKGTELSVSIRGRIEPIRVVKKPLYRRST